MKRCYLAGPYRSKDGEYYVGQNIEEASRVARQLWAMGYAVLAPHKNTAFFGGADIPDQIWLNGDLEWVRVSEVLVLMPNWETSSGTKAEKAEAERIGIPVLEWPNVPNAVVLGMTEP